MKSVKLEIDTRVVELVLTRFISNEITKAGFRRAVIGLSGGIDSALACYLAVTALGSENVMAMRMPYVTSSTHSMDHAQLVIDHLGISSETVNITPMIEPLITVTPNIDPNRLGNVMARMRMILLYDRSAALEALVVGTSNKSELLLGYGTLYGDLASAINPLGDLYKTQVRHLATAMGLPEPILKKEPTADLIPGQTDEADLGFSYAEVDRLLYLLVDERFSPQEAEEAGFDADLIKRVLRMMRYSHFKRNLPLIPKLSGRTISHDFRYLRDSSS